MWSRFGKTTIAVVTLGLTASVVSYQVALAVRNRDYTPGEFRGFLRGFGYNVTPGDTLTDASSKQAVRQFQQGYKLPTDGTANAQTQNLAADLTKNLQGSLNVVVKPNPRLPRNQFYGPRTESAVRQFQKQYNLQQTGIATLPVRQRLDVEAKRALGVNTNAAPSTSTPPAQQRLNTPTPDTSPSPEPSPEITPEATPSPSPEMSPSPSPTTSPNP